MAKMQNFIAYQQFVVWQIGVYVKPLITDQKNKVLMMKLYSVCNYNDPKQPMKGYLLVSSRTIPGDT